jgi:hypothetical protein
MSPVEFYIRYHIFVLSFLTKQKRKRIILKFGGNKMASLGVSVFSAHLAFSLLFMFLEIDLKTNEPK